MNNEPVAWTACLDCGKRVTGDSIHTCSPQLKELTDDEIVELIIPRKQQILDILFEKGWLDDYR